ncbi:MAG TPA: TlpA disulfide reductase family protein [Polyangiaceae bacterium]|jgi:peroxiredoxin
MGHRLSILIPPVFVALAASACAGPAAAPATSASGAPVPAVALSTLAGEHTELARLADGRVALVSLWATWCESCAKEMDALNRLDAKTAAGRDAVVIGVDVGEEPDKVAEFARKRGLRYAQLVDEDFAFADALGQRRVPSTLVVDRHGRIVFRGDALDAKSLEALRQAIAASTR